MIAGAYSRPLMMQNANFFVQTESELNVVDLQTHSLFVDIRIPTDRLRTGAGSLAEMTPQALQDLARCHCFAGYSVVNYDIAGYEGLPVCNRLHCIDWAPIDGEKNNNQWRVQPVWDKGGWVELGVLKDEFAQAAYVEHWETLPGTREGPFLALRRAAGEPSLPWPTMPTLTAAGGGALPWARARARRDPRGGRWAPLANDPSRCLAGLRFRTAGAVSQAHASATSSIVPALCSPQASSAPPHGSWPQSWPPPRETQRTRRGRGGARRRCWIWSARSGRWGVDGR